jgi:glycosyltransferase involved in cell wall biosynthesis
MTAGRRLAYLALETPRPGQASYTHVHEILTELRKLGWSVDLHASTQGGASTATSWLSRLLDYAGTQLWLASRLGRYDAVYVRAHFMAFPIALLAALLGKPVVHEINGRPDDVAVTYRALQAGLPVLKLLYWIQMRLASHLFPVTEGLATWASRFAGHRRVTAIPNAANTRLFCPEGPVADLPFSYVVFVGGLVAWHGVETMLAATRDVAWPADLRLVVIGDGPERHRLSAGSAGPITWLGRLPYEQVPSYLRGSKAALCPIENPGDRSSSGVAPLKLYEAMGCGVPVVATALPFQSELIDSTGAGVVVPVGDPHALALAVRALVEDSERSRWHGLNGARYVANAASWSSRAEQISEILAPLAFKASKIAAGEAQSSLHQGQRTFK